jgi:Holliday junction DNA helicase RuvA
MISSLTGQLVRIDQGRAAVRCGPMEFSVFVPAFDAPDLQKTIGREITFHTIFDLEGDATRGGLTPRLIGFMRDEDRRFFELFITVKGIGPKRALRALSAPVGEIAQAIESKDTKFLIGLSEIGKRTAEQIVAELAGKMAEFAVGPARRAGSAASSSRPGAEEEAISGAMALGLPRPDAERLLDRAKQSAPAAKTPDALLREMMRMRTSRA